MTDSNPSNPFAEPAADKPGGPAARREEPRRERPAWYWFLIVASAAVGGVLLMWPKYQKRRAQLDAKYEALNASHAYRVQQVREALREQGPTDGSPGGRMRRGFPWPVALACAAVALPLAALAFTLLAPRRRPPRRRAKTPAVHDPPDEDVVKNTTTNDGP